MPRNPNAATPSPLKRPSSNDQQEKRRTNKPSGAEVVPDAFTLKSCRCTVDGLVDFKKIEQLAILEMILIMSLEDGLAVDRIATRLESMGVPSLDDFPPSDLAYTPKKMQQYARRNVNAIGADCSI